MVKENASSKGFTIYLGFLLKKNIRKRTKKQLKKRKEKSRAHGCCHDINNERLYLIELCFIMEADSL